MERYTGKHQSDDHAWRRKYHDLPSADDVNVLECEEGEDKVRARDDESDRRWVVKPDLLEDSRAIVHESVKARELLECLETTSDDF